MTPSVALKFHLLSDSPTSSGCHDANDQLYREHLIDGSLKNPANLKITSSSVGTLNRIRGGLFVGCPPPSHWILDFGTAFMDIAHVTQ